MCSHAFHERCLHDSLAGEHFECVRCVDNNIILQRQNAFDSSEGNNFMEKLESSQNKPFDVVAEFFGRGFFGRDKKLT